MIDALVDAAHHEVVAYAGMILILTAFFILDSKASVYLQLMALGSGLLAIRAYLIDEWAFFILEIAWFSAALLGLMSLSKLND